MERSTSGLVHRGLNGVVLAGTLVQVYAAGLTIWGLVPMLHQILGWVLIPLALAAVAAAAVRGSGRRTALSVLLVALIALQPVFVFGLVNVSRYLAALHPLNAVAIIGVAFWVEMSFRQERTTDG